MNNVTTTALPTHCTRCHLPFWADEPRTADNYRHDSSRCAARLLDEVTRLRAENERLRDEAAVLRTIIEDRRKFSLSDEALIKRLDAENERLRAALRSFANRANWTSDGVWNTMDDPWEVAQKALEAQP